MKVLFFYRGSEQLGIESLSAVLRQAGHQTELLYDPGFENNFTWRVDLLKRLNVPRRLVQKAKAFAPDLMAFSCVTNLYPYVKEMAQLIKAELKVPTIIGGIHATVLPEEVLQEECFDIVCRGEGEHALLDLVTRMEKGEDITTIPNLWVKDEHGVIHRNEMRSLIQDLDSLPFADRDLFYRNGAFWRNISLMTGRGCPYRCTYCVNNFLHKINVHHEQLVRRRSVDNVIQELEICKRKYQPKMVTVRDDTFSLGVEWLEELADKYPKRIGLPFQCNVHPLTITTRIVAALKRAGCRSIIMGIQTGNEQMRKTLLKRPDTNEKILEATAIIHKARIPLETEIIIGLPEETSQNVWETVALNRSIAPSSTSTFLFYPFPGTDLAHYCREKGLAEPQNLEQAKGGAGSYFSTMLLNHADPNLAMNVFELLPLYNILPATIGDRVLSPLCARKRGLMVKLLGFLGVFATDPWGVKVRGMDNLYMAWRLLNPQPLRYAT